MSSSGLTDDGYLAPRGADFLALIRSTFEARLVELGFTESVDWSADTFLGLVTTAMADQLGSLSEMNQAVYDAWDVNNATGIQLDNLALIVGVTRTPATYSQVEVTITGDSGTVIPQGAIIEHATTASRWATTEDVTLSAGTGTVIVRAQDAGAVAADADTLTVIVSRQSGWSAVTNADPATPGEPRETDAALRLRRQQAIQTAGSASLNAIRAAILGLGDFISACVVVENTSTATATVSGISLAAHSVGIVVHPDTLTTAQKTDLAQAIYDHVAAGIATNGAQSATVTGLDGFAKTLRWEWAGETTLNVATTVILASGYELADVDVPIQEAIAEYVLTLDVGQAAYSGAFVLIAMGIEGVKQATVTLNAGASVVPDGADLLVLGTNTVST